MIEEHDPHVNALGIKGVGEIGVTGSAGAIANAIWHATGIRVRRFPVRIDDLVTPGFALDFATSVRPGRSAANPQASAKFRGQSASSDRL